MHEFRMARQTIAVTILFLFAKPIFPDFGQPQATESAGTATVVSEMPQAVVHKDENGRISRVERSGDITDFTYDSVGHLSFKQSTRFGRTDYFYSASSVSGPFARVHAMKQSSEVGDWRRIFIYDQEGQMALKLEGINSGTLSAILNRVKPYFWPDGITRNDIEALDPVLGVGFASISVMQEEDGTEVQRTRIFDQEMEIRARQSGMGQLEIRDDFGGSRTEIWSGGTLLSVYDDHGPIIETMLDSAGRPERVVVGGSTVLWYEFEGGSRKWNQRHVTSHGEEEVLGTWRQADDFDQYYNAQLPRRTAVAFLPGSIPIAEWDSETQAGGAVLVTRRGIPYAIIPFSQSEAPWRSISTSFEGVPFQDRIDYTDSRVRIHLSLGPASMAAGSEVVMLIERDRRFQSTTGEASR